MIDYNQYIYTKEELVRYSLCGGGVGFALLMLFYNNVLLCGILSVPAALFFLGYYRRILLERRRWQLTVQFKDAMESLVSVSYTHLTLPTIRLGGFETDVFAGGYHPKRI